MFLPEDTAIILLNGKLRLLLDLVRFLGPLTLLQVKKQVTLIDRVLNWETVCTGGIEDYD